MRVFRTILQKLLSKLFCRRMQRKPGLPLLLYGGAFALWTRLCRCLLAEICVKLACLVKCVMTAGESAVARRRTRGASAPGRVPFISPRRKRLPAPPAAGPHQRWKLRQPTAASPGRKRTCHFKFSAGNWHFIIYVVHVIMLDNITNDAIRSTGNLKWCTPVLTWERSGAHIQPPQLKASSRQRLCPELCSQTDG